MRRGGTYITGAGRGAVPIEAVVVAVAVADSKVSVLSFCFPFLSRTMRGEKSSRGGEGERGRHAQKLLPLFSKTLSLAREGRRARHP